MSHTDYISKVPEGFRITAHTKDCPVAAMSCPERRLYAVQFHPEVMHTREGQTMLRNFVLGVCGCSGEWKMGSFVEQSIHRLDAATAALRLPRRGNRTARVIALIDSHLIAFYPVAIILKKHFIYDLRG